MNFVLLTLFDEIFFSLCTTLCLQWEAEIIAVSLMYLASRLSKFDIQDWEGKPPGSRMKWWEWFVEGITMELMEGKLALVQYSLQMMMQINHG